VPRADLISSSGGRPASLSASLSIVQFHFAAGPPKWPLHFGDLCAGRKLNTLGPPQFVAIN